MCPLVGITEPLQSRDTDRGIMKKVNEKQSEIIQNKINIIFL